MVVVGFLSLDRAPPTAGSKRGYNRTMASASIQSRASGFNARTGTPTPPKPSVANAGHSIVERSGPGDVRTLRTLEYVLGADPAVVRGYAAAIDDTVAARTLTLADRDRLIQRGERLGLRRFDANLVLAAVEQRHRVPRRVTARLPGQVPAAQAPSPAASRRRFVWPTAAVAIGVQVAIVAGAWWLVA
ncbi:MAG: hypothetical protein JWM57_3223 [Phycisphaerales bacterium]|nr:hypothetical protein [Phycisphaerales bacterium]